MAQTKKCILADTLVAAEDLAANRFVTIAGGYPAAAGDNAYGITASKAAVGSPVSVDVLGISIVQVSAAVAAGAALQAGADGRAATQADTNATVARARTAATDENNLIEVFLIPN